MKTTILVSIWEEDGNKEVKTSTFAEDVQDAIGFLEKYGHDKVRTTLTMTDEEINDMARTSHS